MFFPATCASKKTPISPQTWEMCALGAHFMRCSGLQPFQKSACHFFDYIIVVSMPSLEHSIRV